MIPRFCPHPRCSHHQDDRTNEAPYTAWRRAGTYHTKVLGEIQRYVCTSCGRGFSERTFSIDYFAKKTLDYREIHRALVSSESLSAIARHLACSAGSVENRMERLGRASLAMHSSLLEGHTIEEHLVADGFESFDRSQFWPNNINILMGKTSQLLYHSTHTTIRRKGCMTPHQRKKRIEYEKRFKAPRKGIEKSFGRLVAEIPKYWEGTPDMPLRLSTDEHPAYERALFKNYPLLVAIHTRTFEHATYSSKIPRTTTNPLFAVNYFDRELRKDLAAYHRESTCFVRNAANGQMRFACYVAWHNYMKPWRVTGAKQAHPAHAERAGIAEDKIAHSLEGLYRDRPFLSRCTLNHDNARTWLKRIKTPLKTGKEYVPQYAQVA